MPKKVTHQQYSWESKRSLEIAKEIYGGSVRYASHSLKKERRMSSQQSNQRSDYREHIPHIPLTQTQEQSVKYRRAARTLNATQSALALLYFTAITGLVEASTQSLTQKHISRRTVEHRENKKQSSHRERHRDITASNPPQKYHNHLPKKNHKVSRNIQDFIHSISRTGQNRYRHKTDTQNRENQQTKNRYRKHENEENKRASHRKQRALGGLVPEKEDLITALNEYFANEHSQIKMLLHGIGNTLIANQQASILKNQDFINAFTKLHALLSTIITAQPLLINHSTKKLSTELFSLFDLNNIDASHQYRTQLFRLIDRKEKNNIASSLMSVYSLLNRDRSTESMRFLHSRTLPKLTIHQRQILFILLNLLPSHPAITANLLAAISADIKLELLEKHEEIDGILRQENIKTQFDIFTYAFGESPRNEALRKPFTIGSAPIMKAAFYVGSSYGYCFSLSLHFLHSLSQYSIEQAEQHILSLYEKLVNIQQFSYEESARYVKGIYLLTLDVYNIFREKYEATLSDFHNDVLYQLNTQCKLKASNIAELIFSSDFVPEANNFIVLTESHAVAIYRHKTSTLEGKETLFAYYFDSEYGAVEVDSRERLQHLIIATIKKDEVFSLYPIRDIKKIAPYKTMYGATFEEFFNNNIVDNPNFKPPLVTMSTSRNELIKNTIRSQNTLLPQKDAINHIMTELVPYINNFQDYITSLQQPHDGEGTFVPIVKRIENIQQSLHSCASKECLRSVATEIIEVTDSIEERLSESSQQEWKDDTKAQRLRKQISKKMNTLLYSVEEILPPLTQPSRVKNIAISFYDTLEFNGKSRTRFVYNSELYNIIPKEKQSSYKGTLYSEIELQKQGVYNLEESISIKNLFKELQYEIESLLKQQNLPPQDYVFQKLENIKTGFLSLKELDILKQDTIHGTNIKTGKQITFRIKSPSTLNIMKTLHTKLYTLHTNAEPFFHGLTAYRTTMTLMQVRSMIDIGKSFHRLSDLQKSTFITSVIDSSLDLTATGIAATNYLYKNLIAPINSLSTVSRTFGMISGGFSAISSIMILAERAVDYSKSPREIESIQLGFAITNTALMTATLADPLLSILTLPIMLVLNLIEMSLVKSKSKQEVQQEIVKRKEKEIILYKELNLIMQQWQDEVDLYTEENDLLYIENSSALIRSYRGVRGISKGKNGVITIRRSPTIHGYTKSSPEEAVYPDAQCISQYNVIAESYCPNIESTMSEDEKKNLCTQYPMYRYSLQTTESQSNVDTEDEGAYTVELLGKENVITLFIAEQFKIVKKINMYSVGYTQGYYTNSIIDKIVNLYKDNTYLHKIPLCSRFNAMELYRYTASIDQDHHKKYLVNVDIGISFLKDCYVISREPTYIYPSSTPFVIIPPDAEYHSREYLLEEVKKKTGCTVYNKALEEHATIIVSEAQEDITQILLQGTNIIILKAHTKESSTHHGFFLINKSIQRVSIGKSNSKNTLLLLQENGEDILQYNTTKVNIGTTVKEGIPIYLYLQSGLIVMLTYIDNQYYFNPVLYAFSLVDLPETDTEHRRFLAQRVGSIITINPLWKLLHRLLSPKDFGSLIFQKLDVGLGDTYIPSEFLVEVDKYPKVKQKEEYQYGIYLHRSKYGEDRVMYMRTPIVPDTFMSSIDPSDYIPLHFQKYPHNYLDTSDTKINVMYFYNEKDKMLAVQKDDEYLNVDSFIKVSVKPSFTQFSDGSRGLVIEGCAIRYQEEGFPVEVHLTKEFFLIYTDIDSKIKNIAQQMRNDNIKEELIYPTNIILKAIPYTSQKSTKEQQFLSGYYDIMFDYYELTSYEYEGAMIFSLDVHPFIAKDSKIYTYLFSKQGDRYTLYTRLAISDISNMVQGGIVDISLLPPLLPLFPHIEIEKIIISSEKSCIMKTKSGLLLESILQGPHSQVRIMGISDTFMEEYGYNPHNTKDIARALFFAQMLYGKLFNEKYVLVSYANKKEFCIFSLEEQDTFLFSIDNIYKRRSNSDVQRITLHSQQDKDHTDVEIHLPSKETIEEDPVIAEALFHMRHIPDTSRTKRESEFSVEGLLPIDMFDIVPIGYSKDREGNKSTYMWYKETESLIITYTTPNETRISIYQLELLIQHGKDILIRLSKHHTTMDNNGIIFPNIIRVTFESSCCIDSSQDVKTKKTYANVQRPRLVYTQQDIEMLEEIILNHREDGGLLPIIQYNQEPASIVVYTSSYTKDILVSIEYYNERTAKKDYIDIRLVGFQNYPSTDENPYHSCLMIKDKLYTAQELAQHASQLTQ